MSTVHSPLVPLTKGPAVPPPPAPAAPAQPSASTLPVHDANALLGGPVSAIMGTGRSGSTWLGAILSSHPDVIYRFEPLRPSPHPIPHLAQFCSDLASRQFTTPPLYDILLGASPDIEKPPFFPKNFRLAPGRSLLWPLTKKLPVLGPLFRTLYTPRRLTHRPPLIFKLVGCEQFMSQLLELTSIRLIYLVRHPAAVVSSIIRGQQRGLMPTDRQSVVASRCREIEPQLLSTVALLSALRPSASDTANADHLCPLEIETIHWRLDLHIAMNAIRNNPNTLLIFYEELCHDPVATCEKIFAHLHLTLHPRCRTFIDQSTHAHEHPAYRYGEFGIDPYFSVFRDIRTEKDNWRRRLSQDEQSRILQLVADTEIYQLARARNLW